MPTLTRWMIKTSLVYLVLALVTGVLLAAGWAPSSLTPAYFHLYMVGWVSMFIFGVVFWMFPKFSQAKPRGSERLGWATYLLINAGLLLRVLGEGIIAGAGWLLVASSLLQWLGGLAFVLNTWPRVKEK